MTPAQALLHQVTLDPAWPTLTPELREAITEELEGVVPAHVTGWRTPPCTRGTSSPAPASSVPAAPAGTPREGPDGETVCGGLRRRNPRGVRGDRNATNGRHRPRHAPGNGTFRQPVTHRMRGPMHDDPHLNASGLRLCGCPKCEDHGACICPNCDRERCGLHPPVQPG
jgi:hypothetical protein